MAQAMKASPWLSYPSARSWRVATRKVGISFKPATLCTGAAAPSLTDSFAQQSKDSSPLKSS